MAKNAWGRESQESQAEHLDAWGRPRPARSLDASDFREVGLSEDDAAAALAGLAEGRYLSFEDACLSRAIFGRTKPVPINESLMRSKAREFARGGSSVSEQAISWEEIDADLGISGPDPAVVANFVEAGFEVDEARRGAEMMASGRYFGFEDVATSLRPSGSMGRVGMSPVMETRIQRIAKRISEAKP